MATKSSPTPMTNDKLRNQTHVDPPAYRPSHAHEEPALPQVWLQAESPAKAMQSLREAFEAAEILMGSPQRWCL
jgi:hypothetical protein